MASIKSKTTTYVLIVIVVIVWGIIIKKIFFTDTEYVPVENKIKSKTIEGDIVEKLRLDYRDPFMPYKKTNTKPSPKIEVKSKDLIVNPRSHNRENMILKYIGKLQCGNAINYIIDINNTQYTFSKNEIINEVELIKVSYDSLYFKKNDKIYSLLIKD